MTLYHNASGGMDDEKKNFSVGYGGVIAVGALSLEMPVAVQAAGNVTADVCEGDSEKHIESKEVTTIDGLLTVTIDFKDSETTNGYSVSFYALEKQLNENEYKGEANCNTVPTEWEAEGSHPGAKRTGTSKGSDTYTFTGLTSGKTYYIYCVVKDWHGEKQDEDTDAHGAAYLGSGIPTADTGSSTGNTVVPETETIVPETETTTVAAGTVETAAAEVIKGKWGIGSERRIRLEAAGYDYREVQKVVNKLMK